MAHSRLPSPFRGVPGRLGAVVLLASAFGGWGLWPRTAPLAVPPALTLEGKHVDRLAFGADESEIPVRHSRIYDTVAMFSQPQAAPREWSAAPVPGTIQEAGIRPMQRPLPPPRVASKATDAPRSVRTAASPPVRPSGTASATDVPLTILGWDVPGSRHVPGRQEVTLAFAKVGQGAASVGTGTARVVSRTASALGDGLASAGGAIADTLGIN